MIRVRTLAILWIAIVASIAFGLPTINVTEGQPGSAGNPAVISTDRLHESWWSKRHQGILDAIKSHPDTQLLLIGDSITNNYDKAKLPDENFQPTWNEFYETRKALNLGFSGDTTSNVLWRIDHGEVSGLHPKAVVLMIGTNNTGLAGQTAEQTEIGIDAVIADLEGKLPDARILLLGILPSDVSQAKTASDRSVNHYLSVCYGENPRVAYLDIGSVFYKNNVLNTTIFYDPRLPQHGKPLHPDTIGQRMMAEAIEPTLAKLMGAPPQVPFAAMTDINTALIPVAQIEQDSYDWYARHHAELETAKTLKPRVVLIGDSITHFWGGDPNAIRVSGRSAWQRAFGGIPVLNMGFGWDRTQNVLWRIRQGEMDGLSPEWIVLAIGTNNLTSSRNARGNTPEETVDGIDAIIRELRQRSPLSRLVLMAIFPRGKQPASPLRSPIKETNRLLAKRFANVPSVAFLDIGQQFLATDGSIPASIMPDGTHPSDAGYKVWADALIKAGMRP